MADTTPQAALAETLDGLHDMDCDLVASPYFAPMDKCSCDREEQAIDIIRALPEGWYLEHVDLRVMKQVLAKAKHLGHIEAPSDD